MTDTERTPGESKGGQRTNRRAFLSLAGATAAIGLAGCLGGGDDGGSGGGDGTETGSGSAGDDGSGADGPFSNVAFEEGELMVTLERDVVATVNAFHDGEQIGSTDVSTGAEQVGVFKASQTLNGEEIRLVAVDSDDKQIGETTASFAAQPEVTGIRTRAAKNDREATEEAANEYTEDFATALVTIENTGDGPLFIDKWRGGIEDHSDVYIADGVPNAVTPDEAEGGDSPTDRALVPSGGSIEIIPYTPTGRQLMFKTTDGENEEWPESVRSMGEFPDGYADGDEVEVTVVVEDNTGERVETTLTATYDGGLVQTHSSLRNNYVPLEFEAE